jgi:hypothetical protein
MQYHCRATDRRHVSAVAKPGAENSAVDWKTLAETRRQTREAESAAASEPELTRSIVVVIFVAVGETRREISRDDGSQIANHGLCRYSVRAQLAGREVSERRLEEAKKTLS